MRTPQKTKRKKRIRVGRVQGNRPLCWIISLAPGNVTHRLNPARQGPQAPGHAVGTTETLAKAMPSLQATPPRASQSRPRAPVSLRPSRSPLGCELILGLIDPALGAPPAQVLPSLCFPAVNRPGRGRGESKKPVSGGDPWGRTNPPKWTALSSCRGRFDAHPGCSCFSRAA